MMITKDASALFATSAMMARCSLRVLDVGEGDLLWKLPHEEESVADVFIRGSAVKVHLHVDDLADGVDELHDALLEHLGGIGELTNVAEAEDGDDFLPRDHGVDLAAAFHVLGDDLGAGFAESDGEEPADLGDGVLEHARLHLRATVVVVLKHLEAFQRVLAHLTDLLDHAFNRLEHEGVGILAEQHRAEPEHETHERRATHVQRSLEPAVVAHFEERVGYGTVCFGDVRGVLVLLASQAGSDVRV